jgi:hypothetical protein
VATLEASPDAQGFAPLPQVLTPGDCAALAGAVHRRGALSQQAVCVLSRRSADYTGGEFLLVEQRPRAQSRGHAIAIEQGCGLVFATRDRPVIGSRGTYRTAMRHGVSTITSGSRVSLGIIFHDAR